ncbi:hypothetical protein L7750_19880 [Xenorhabdus bovienii]|uniref:hypothetical protein n=1 Tax=Xenorhabdus bovienii TaxID=40576 RepID=UPI001EDD8F83|nr:hypothetical protein [Xenorhabdus bovienii]MCG3472534.1 hypothetical protein [Xenorhabdus bovienii]
MKKNSSDLSPIFDYISIKKPIYILLTKKGNFEIYNPNSMEFPDNIEITLNIFRNKEVSDEVKNKINDYFPTSWKIKNDNLYANVCYKTEIQEKCFLTETIYISN